MKEYHKEETSERPPWMPLFISLMLVLLTLFIFLTTFAESDPEKIRIFREQFRESLMLSGQGGLGRVTVVDSGTPDDPLRSLINRMKAKGIDKKLMDEFLTVNQIKELEVMDGERGVAIVLPETVVFDTGKNQLTGLALDYLASIFFLVAELPYVVDIKGYASGRGPAGYADALEFSARRAMLVYDYFISRGVPAMKLKVSGCGDAFEDGVTPRDKVEIIFKSPEL